MPEDLAVPDGLKPEAGGEVLFFRAEPLFFAERFDADFLGADFPAEKLREGMLEPDFKPEGDDDFLLPDEKLELLGNSDLALLVKSFLPDLLPKEDPGLKELLGGPAFFLSLSIAVVTVLPGCFFESDPNDDLLGVKPPELGGEKPPLFLDLLSLNEKLGGGVVADLESFLLAENDVLLLGALKPLLDSDLPGETGFCFLFLLLFLDGLESSTKDAGWALLLVDVNSVLLSSFPSVLVLGFSSFDGSSDSESAFCSCWAISSGSFLNFELKTAQEPRPTNAPIMASLEIRPNE